MKYLIHLLKIIFIATIGIYNANAQSNIRFEHLTTKDGLSINSIFSICQDKEGFMWFGTWYGVNKYDGYSFTEFKHDPANTKTSLVNNVINTMLEDSKGRLWLGTWEGLHLVDKVSGDITPFLNPADDWFAFNAITSLAEDKQGNLWLGTYAGIH
ncbi:MAG TPA: two-component regulator propeller domain-containing protein, partial [Draconibacterium sp.]|nr:two-component regulator propeller domain-containing protein [Draconibacterium sp.]